VEQSHRGADGYQFWLSHLAVLFYENFWFKRVGILIMRRLLLTAIVCLMPLAAHAEPSSAVAWTPATLKLVKNGNPATGKDLAQACQACHGANGEGTKAQIRDGETLPAIPAIAGQLATYTYKQLRDYNQGVRGDASMTGIAKGLSEQNAADLAAWFSTLPAPVNKASAKPTGRAEKMVRLGDGKRLLPPCFVCHGGNGQGEKMDSPALSGQHADYLVSTLQAYKKGERHNDIYSRMRLIAQQLKDEEIKELADYYQQLER
jgi:cytochrome c553